MTWPEFVYIARWYGVLVALTWGLAPVARLLGARLPDRGATIARPLALLAVVYPSWLLANLDLIPYSTVGLWATLATGSAIGWFAAQRRGLIDRRMLRSLLAAEVIALAAFIAYVWLRGYTPEIVNTEKPMDIAFLASSARATSMPPPDPWLAGESINYYYLGYVLHGAVVRLAAIPATVGFNLALATTFSMTLVATAGLGFNAVRPWFGRRSALAAGAISAILLGVAGNLYAPSQLLRTPRNTWEAGWWNKEFGVGWRSSRVVCDGARTANDCVGAGAVEPITEFPFFSFLLGDLHPHVTALPFTLAAMALALAWALRARGEPLPLGQRDVLPIAATGVLVGSLYALNSWDYPTYLFLTALAIGVGFRDVSNRSRWLAIAILAVSSLMAWLPFIGTFAPLTHGDTSSLPDLLNDLPGIPRLLTAVAYHTGDRTSAGEFLTMFGVPYVAALWLLGTGLAHPRAAAATAPPRWTVVLAIAGTATALLAEVPLLLLCGAPLAGAGALLARRPVVSARVIATALFAAGFAIVLVTEGAYIQDVFGNRMNTIFKAYYQVWTLVMVATGITLAVLWQEARPRRLARPAVALFLSLALVTGAAYPLLASLRWTEFWGPRTWQGLDGVEFVGRETPDELAALRWLAANARDGDVVAEAAGCSYQPGSQVPFGRAAAYTGVPSIVGWQGHETQWRAGQPDLLREVGQLGTIGPRQRAVADIFAAPNGEVADRYGVTLLYVGRYEREFHGCEIGGPYPEVVAPDYPGLGWREAFVSGDVRIFRRDAAG